MHLVIVEERLVPWSYHLLDPMPAREGVRTALCGASDLLPPQLPLRSWNFEGHLRERFCRECDSIARAAGASLPE